MTQTHTINLRPTTHRQQRPHIMIINSTEVFKSQLQKFVDFVQLHALILIWADHLHPILVI